jgi:ABC-type amino acid transport substrate-binding protein
MVGNRKPEIPPSLAMSLVLGLVLAVGCILYFDAKGRHSIAPGAETINIVTSLLPPYVDEEGRGREADIVRSALEAAFREESRSISVQFYVQPFAHHWLNYISDQRYDAVTTVPDGLRIDGYESDHYINYQNGIGYKAGQFPQHLADFSFDKLAGHRVVAFAGASQIIPNVQRYYPRFALYLEEPDQSVHSRLLMENVVDAVLADGSIFFEYNRRLNNSRDIPGVFFAAVFCPTPYKMIFRTSEMKNRFNRGLAIIAGNGRLAEIEDRFLRDSAPPTALVKPAKCI